MTPDYCNQMYEYIQRALAGASMPLNYRGVANAISPSVRGILKGSPETFNAFVLALCRQLVRYGLAVEHGGGRFGRLTYQVGQRLA
jgi:hypothetical protein